MRRTVLAAAFLALLVSACGSAAPSQESKFKNGDQAAVAKLVDDLAAGRAGKADKICSDILAKQLVDELKSAGGDCVTEMDRAINDANDYDLKVDSVKVNGTTATARVRQGESKTVATFSFVKEKDGWRALALGG